jgi:hypothetical protein
VNRLTPDDWLAREIDAGRLPVSPPAGALALAAEAIRSTVPPDRAHRLTVPKVPAGLMALAS